MIKIHLKPGKEVPILRFHPWVFSGAIARVEGQPEDGDAAGVYDRSGQLLGVGHFHNGSITVRMLSFGPADLNDPQFWVDKLTKAAAARQAMADAADAPAARSSRLAVVVAAPRPSRAAPAAALPLLAVAVARVDRVRHRRTARAAADDK